MSEQSFSHLAASLAIDAGLSLRGFKRLMESEYIREALSRSDGNQCKAAKLAGLHRNTLGRRVQDLDRK
jgi:transcriptional regulator with PAS, ATPase and Fis domain